MWSTALVLLIATVSGAIYVSQLMKALEPRVAKLHQLGTQINREPTIVYSSDGLEICRLAQEKRHAITWPEIPQVVIDATVAAEDHRFWEHRGVDHIAILRAIWVNLQAGAMKQGGSTITQQVAKRLLTTGERTLQRKFEDACLALMIEREYTKEQIITLYLNEVFYGSGAYGIKAAAEVYFGKNLRDITLSEAALLARIPRRPSEQNPFVDIDAAKRNRNKVLKLMLEEGYITSAQYDEALKEPIKLAPKPILTTGIKRAPYFATYILDQLRKEFPDEDFARGGYQVYTTLNTEAQAAAEKALKETLNKYRGRKVTEGAIIVTDYSGQILAMVGGANVKKSQYNNITQGRRQPGSAFKPFVYAAAMEMALIKPTSMVSNEPFVWRDPTSRYVWKPKGGGGGGMVSVQTALVNSINVPAVHVGKMVGASNLARFAKEVFGIDSKLDPVLPLALGSSAVSPFEMAEAFSVFATGGNRVKLYGIKRVVGPTGNVLRDYKPVIVANVLSESTAMSIRDMLRRVVLSGTGTTAAGVANAAGKTGTNEDYLDAWFCGFTDRLIAVSWVANATYDPNRTPAWRYGSMSGVFGGHAPTYLWAKALKPIQQMIGEKPSGRSPANFGGGGASRVSALICIETNCRAIPGACPKTETRVLTPVQARELPTCGTHGIGQEPTPIDPGEPIEPPPATKELPPGEPPPPETLTLQVCVETGDRATDYCPVKRIEQFSLAGSPRRYCRIHSPFR